MRRVVALVVLVVLASCRTAPLGGPAPGADSSEAAVAQFLAAARAQDLQALSAVWGNAESPTRDRVNREELEKRLLIIMCHLRHEESRIGSAQAGEAGRRLHQVELTQGAKNATSRFTAVRQRDSGRWFVEDMDMQPLQAFCTAMPPPGDRASYSENKTSRAH